MWAFNECLVVYKLSGSKPKADYCRLQEGFMRCEHTNVCAVEFKKNIK